MDKYSRVAWHTNPNASAGLGIAEKELAHKLFASFEVAWNHPALQKCLHRHVHMVQTDCQSSNLNAMTLFSVIWKYECPGSHNSHSVWMAMRAELDDILVKLVSHFHAHTRGEYTGTEEIFDGIQTSNISRDNQVQHRARETAASVKSPHRQIRSSEEVPVHEQLAKGPVIDNQSFTSYAEPCLQLHYSRAGPVAIDPGRRHIFPEAAPKVYNPPSEQSSGLHFIQRYGSEIQPDLACTSYPISNHALQSDLLAPRASPGSDIYHAGFEHSYQSYFVQAFGPVAPQSAHVSSNLAPSYATLDPHFWQEDLFSPQMTYYHWMTNSEVFNTSVSATRIVLTNEDQASHRENEQREVYREQGITLQV
ncbi:hypothetical protein F5878DRAFT_661166 [Lentinula raphanica]|uniref:Uncharacterized protein n=1 Tax=Lentinula raphanica TaxID=153919 RepID=A0AA38P9A2_9AGAR|nr:hypothetical protein F5878DRAFT_661166 [Lentinula raphanica]